MQVDEVAAKYLFQLFRESHNIIQILDKLFDCALLIAFQLFGIECFQRCYEFQDGCVDEIIVA